MSHGPQARAKRAHESRMVQGAATIEMMDLRSGSNEAHLDQGVQPRFPELITPARARSKPSIMPAGPPPTTAH